MSTDDRTTTTGRRTGRGLDARASTGDLFSRGWWAIALRGAFAIVLGLVVLTHPAMTVGLFVGIVGGYLFLDGIFTLIATFHAARDGQSWWPYLFEGLLSVGAGTLAFARPMSALFFIVLMLAVRALVVGAVEIGTGVALRQETGRSPWLLWLGGLASLAFGLLLFTRPTPTVLALTWILGIYALAFGVMLDGEALRARRAARGRRHDRLATGAA